MLLSTGAECIYVPEYMDRPPVVCEVVELVDRTNRNTEIFLIDLSGGDDESLGARVYVEVGPADGLKDPENIIPVRTYLVNDAWKHEPVRFGVDIVENGFVCTKSAYKKYFHSNQ